MKCPDAPRANDLAAIHESLNKFTELRIRKRLDETLTVPPLPEAARRMIALKSNPDYAVRDVTRSIEAAPAEVCDAVRLSARFKLDADAVDGVMKMIKGSADELDRLARAIASQPLRGELISRLRSSRSLPC